MEFKDRLKEIRTEHGVYQKDVAKYLNVRNTTVSAWETGDNEPDIETLKKLATFFHTSIDYLVGFSDNEFSNFNEELTIDKIQYKRKTK